MAVCCVRVPLLRLASAVSLFAWGELPFCFKFSSGANLCPGSGVGGSRSRFGELMRWVSVVRVMVEHRCCDVGISFVGFEFKFRLT